MEGNPREGRRAGKGKDVDASEDSSPSDFETDEDDAGTDTAEDLSEEIDASQRRFGDLLAKVSEGQARIERVSDRLVAFDEDLGEGEGDVEAGISAPKYKASPVYWRGDDWSKAERDKLHLAYLAVTSGTIKGFWDLVQGSLGLAKGVKDLEAIPDTDDDIEDARYASGVLAICSSGAKVLGDLSGLSLLFLTSGVYAFYTVLRDHPENVLKLNEAEARAVEQRKSDLKAKLDRLQERQSRLAANLLAEVQKLQLLQRQVIARNFQQGGQMPALSTSSDQS